MMPPYSVISYFLPNRPLMHYPSYQTKKFKKYQQSKTLALMKQEKCDFYENPLVEVMDIISEGVLCGSVPPGGIESGEDGGNFPEE